MSNYTEAERKLLTAPEQAKFTLIMFLVCLFDFADRSVFSAAAQTIRQELELRDFHIGLLSGIMFAALYSIVGIPIGRLAEHTNRIRIVAVCTAIWSVATMWCGMAQNFLMLALGRVGVGFGEAGFMGPTVSLNSDRYKAEKRASRMSLILLGTPVGTFLGATLGGWAAQAHSWRLAFYILGAGGLLTAILVWLLLRETPRGLADDLPRSPAPPFDAPRFLLQVALQLLVCILVTGGTAFLLRAAGVPFAWVVGVTLGVGIATVIVCICLWLGAPFLRLLLKKKALLFVIIGGSIASIGMTSVSQFMNPFLQRTHQLPPAEAGPLFGAISATALAIGLLTGSWGSDLLARWDKRWWAWGPAIGLTLAPIVYWMAWTADTVPGVTTLLIIAGATLLLFYGPTVAMIQNMVEPKMRARGAAFYSMLYAMIGYGIGPQAVGFLSDLFASSKFVGVGDFHAACPGGRAPAGSPESLVEACRVAEAGGLQQALMIMMGVFFVAALAYLIASRRLAADFYKPGEEAASETGAAPAAAPKPAE